MLSYGLECPCHGVRRFASAAERDAAAITYQCKVRFFRIREKQFVDRPTDVLQ